MYIFGLLLAAAVLNLLAFRHFFGFLPISDTMGFISAIDFFRGFSSPIYPNRYLNPLYPVVSTYVLPFLSASHSLIVLNIVFYLVLVYATYGLIRRVFQNYTVGLVSALMVMTAYPMLRYALKQVQDLGGYAWFVLTIYIGWRWYEDRNPLWLHLAGIAIAFGVLTKESGCMGALFVGILILHATSSLSEKIRHIARVSWAPLLTLIVNASRSHDMAYNSLQWIIDNWHMYAAANYHMLQWVGVNTSTYNILWVFFGITMFMVIRKKWLLSQQIKLYALAVIPSSLSYFAWPLFISRTVFISAWLIIPFAAYGIVRLSQQSKTRLVVLVAIVVCTPYVLQSTLRYTHIFKIIDDCHRNIPCMWYTFWQQRTIDGPGK